MQPQDDHPRSLPVRELTLLSQQQELAERAGGFNTQHSLHCDKSKECANNITHIGSKVGYTAPTMPDTFDHCASRGHANYTAGKSTSSRMASPSQAIDRENVIEELGDLEFYMEGVRQNLGITREETLNHNIQKLSKRYEGNEIHGQKRPRTRR